MTSADGTDMPYNVGQMRIEMGRLVQVMMGRNAAYMRREAELEELYGHDPLLLRMRLNDDYQLTKASNAAKSCAMLVTALATAINAEIAFLEHHRG